MQCYAGGDNLAAALRRQGECNNHERERACATLCKFNYILLCATLVLWSICEDMCSNCENMCSNCAPMDPLAVVLAARGGEAEKLHQQRMSAAVKVHVLRSIQVQIRHKMPPEIHNQQHNNFSSLFFLSDTTSLEINCQKPNFWWISMMRERKKSLLVSKQRVDL